MCLYAHQTKSNSNYSIHCGYSSDTCHIHYMKTRHSQHIRKATNHNRTKCCKTHTSNRPTCVPLKTRRSCSQFQLSTFKRGCTFKKCAESHHQIAKVFIKIILNEINYISFCNQEEADTFIFLHIKKMHRFEL